MSPYRADGVAFVFCPHCGARVEYTPNPRQVIRETDGLRIQFYDRVKRHKCKEAS